MRYENDLLMILKVELAYLDQGRYDLPGTPPRMKMLMVESPICPNFGNEGERVPCEQCKLVQFVDPRFRDLPLPCHYIALDREGHTIVSLAGQHNVTELKKHYRKWLVERIAEMEAGRGGAIENGEERDLHDST